MTAPEPAVSAGQAAGCGDLPGGDQLVPAAPGGRGQGRQDGTGLYRGGAVVVRRVPGRASQVFPLGAGERPGCAAVDDVAAGPVQRRLCRQPVPWLAAVLQVAGRRRGTPGPAGRRQPPRVTGKLVPVFTGGELARLGHACAGRGVAQRRDAGIVAVCTAAGIRVPGLAGIRYRPDDARLSGIGLWQPGDHRRR